MKKSLTLALIAGALALTAASAASACSGTRPHSAEEARRGESADYWYKNGPLARHTETGYEQHFCDAKPEGRIAKRDWMHFGGAMHNTAYAPAPAPVAVTSTKSTTHTSYSHKSTTKAKAASTTTTTKTKTHTSTKKTESKHD